jgi:histone-lysine N-methyltransferase SETMAR
VYRWVEQFEAGRVDVADLPRAGRPEGAESKALADRILDLLDEDSRQTIREMADRMNVPKSSVHDCISNMGLVKLSARWIPRILTAEMKLQREQTSRSNLSLADRLGGWETFCPRIVTGDETWIPHFNPLSKQQSMVWTTKGSNPPLKACQEPHCKKIMMLLFFDCYGPITIDFLEPNATINADRYVATLNKLKPDIHNKRRTGVKPNFLHHDNARPHVAQRTVEEMARLNFDRLPHPPYSPDLAPCDFAIFPRLKALLRGHVYENRDCLETEVRRILHYAIPREFYRNAIDALRVRWEKCIHLHGDYVEKVSLAANEDE